MQENLLQSYLDAGLFDIGDDDEKFKHLQSASSDIAGRLAQKRQDVINLASIAFAPEFPVVSPVVTDIENSIKARWHTYHGRFKETPEQLIRAVALQALQIATTASHENNEEQKVDRSIGAATYLIGINFSIYQSPGNQKDISVQFLRSLGEQMERFAEDTWSTIPLFGDISSLPKFEAVAGILNPGSANIDEEMLSKNLMAAVGPQKDAAGQVSGPSPNPNWPDRQGAWVAEFGPRAAKAITEAINSANEAMASNIEKAFTGLGVSLSDFLSRYDGHLQPSTQIEMRTNLLWWKETLYSPSLHVGYRSLSPTIVVVALAHDLHSQTPQYHPQSVEFLLGEIAQEVLGNTGNTCMSLSQFCEQFADEIGKSSRGAGIFEPNRHSMYDSLSFLGLLKDLAYGQSSAVNVSERVGVAGDAEVSLRDVGIWLYRELQALRLVSTN